MPDGIVSSLAERAVRFPAGKQILRAGMAVARGFFAVSAVGAVRELLIARRFGTSDAVDAYLIALVLPLFCVTVIAGSFDAAVVPSFVHALHHDGKEAAQRLFANFFTVALLILVSAVAVLAVIFPFVVPQLAASFPPAKIALTLRLFYILVPVVAIAGISYIFGAVLNSMESFSVVALTPAVTPLLMSALLLIFYRRVTIGALALTYTTGAVCEAVILALALLRRGISIVPGPLRLTDETRNVLRQYVTMVAGGILMTLTTVVDQTMAAMLGGGAPASFNYAAKVVSFGTGAASVAVGTAVMPYFSRMVAAQEWSELSRSLAAIVRVIFFITVPIAALLFVFSAPVVRLLFQRGAFGPHDTAVVAYVQQMLCLQIPFFAMSIPIVRAVAALRANHILAITAGLNLVVNCVLNYVLMQRIGVAGIALSTSIVYVVSFSFLTIMLRRRLAWARQHV